MAASLFARTEQRSFLWPWFVAALLAVGVAWTLLHPASRVQVKALETKVVPTRTVFGPAVGDGEGSTIEGLYVVQTLALHNGLTTPLVPESFVLTLTDATGAVLAVEAVRRDDISSLRTSFPAMDDLLVQPLFRETEIAPGGEATGALVFEMKIPEETWQKRRGATIKTGFYHQEAVVVKLP